MEYYQKMWKKNNFPGSQTTYMETLLYFPGNQINILPHNERGNIVPGF